MKRAVIGIGVLALVLGIGILYLKQTAVCFWSTGAITLPEIVVVQKGQPISLKFRMLRISAPGCFKGHSSESYTEVGCGYRLGASSEWVTAKFKVIEDSANEYIVECLIPPISLDTSIENKLDYYFQYSAWGKPTEKRFASISIK